MCQYSSKKCNRNPKNHWIKSLWKEKQSLAWMYASTTTREYLEVA